MITYTMVTLGGVLTADEPSGRITVTLEDGSTIITVSMVDGHGNTVRGFLTHGEAVKLILALGASAVDL